MRPEIADPRAVGVFEELYEALDPKRSTHDRTPDPTVVWHFNVFKSSKQIDANVWPEKADPRAV